MNGQNRNDIKIGSTVKIVLKKDQPTGVLTEGIVGRILTNSKFHHRGIKVMLTDGQVGRVQEILENGKQEEIKQDIEMWDIYDENKNLTGRTIKRDQKLQDGEYHLAVDIWVVDNDSKILISKRHPSKPFALLWECQGGAVLSQETSVEGAVRELKEEVNIITDKEKLIYIGTEKNKDYFMDTYALRIEKIEPEKIKFQDTEIIAVKAVSIEEFNKMIEQQIVTPNLIKRYEKYKNKIFSI